MLSLEPCLCKNSQAHLTVLLRCQLCLSIRYPSCFHPPPAPMGAAEPSSGSVHTCGTEWPAPQQRTFKPPPLAYCSLDPPPACTLTDPWWPQRIPHSPQHEGALGRSGGPEGRSQLRRPGEHHGGLGHPEQIARWSSWWRIWVQTWGTARA